MSFVPAGDGSLILSMFRSAEMEYFEEDSAYLYGVNVSEGQQVDVGDCLLEFAGFKLDNEVFPPCPCRVEKILVSGGETVVVGNPMMILRPL